MPHLLVFSIFNLTVKQNYEDIFSSNLSGMKKSHPHREIITICTGKWLTLQEQNQNTVLWRKLKHGIGWSNGQYVLPFYI